MLFTGECFVSAVEFLVVEFFGTVTLLPVVTFSVTVTLGALFFLAIVALESVFLVVVFFKFVFVFNEYRSQED